MVLLSAAFVLGLLLVLLLLGMGRGAQLYDSAKL
jgi:hypothetical protein